MQDFERLSREADAAGFRLEVVRGIATWEASPVLRHQRAVVRVVNSIRPMAVDSGSCACIAATDVQVLFPDGSRKRPDVAIFCGEPEEDSEITLLPEAVVEELSKDYEAKDLVIGVPFYRQRR
jgi:Uma2 family endonuclease